jgi:hypothetical protein
VETAKYLARGEQTTLGVTQTNAVGFRTLIERTPEQHRLTKVFGKTGTDELGTKVAVGQEEPINPCGAELIEHLDTIVLVKEKPFVVDIIDINKLDA